MRLGRGRSLFRIGRALAVLLVSGWAVAAAPPGTVQSYDGYKSWLVACDNTLACVAKGFGEVSESEMKVEREAGAGGALTLSIRATHDFALAAMRIDGKPAGLAAPAWRRAVSDGETTVTSHDLGAIRALVQRLRNAATLSLAGDDAVPLDGFAAAMLRLDERQGRLDGVTALIRPGPAPASAVPAAPPLPGIALHPIGATLRAGEAARLVATVRADAQALFDKEACEADPPSMQAEAHALDGKQALVLIPCGMGAYQGSSLAFIAPRDGGRARPVVAPMPYLGNDPDPPDSNAFTEVDFDPKDGTLSMHGKGRGIADCGVSASWIWDGAAFRLAEMSLQQACGGVEPGDWPTLFRSRH